MNIIVVTEALSVSPAKTSPEVAQFPLKIDVPQSLPPLLPPPSTPHVPPSLPTALPLKPLPLISPLPSPSYLVAYE